MNSFLSPTELLKIGLRHIGEDVQISRKASFYGAHEIEIGNHVRIDDFCILSGRIRLGNYIHVAAFCAFYGGTSGIEVDDYANFSSRISVYAVSDDYSGYSMTNPMIPNIYKRIDDRQVRIGRHVIIGAGSVLLPGITLHEGSAVGALSLVNSNIPNWSIYGGVPAKFIKQRNKHLLEFENEFVNKEMDNKR